MPHDLSPVFLELGTVLLGLAVLARLASRLGFSAIPLYLLAGLAFGNGGLVPLHFSHEFVHIGSEIGVILLLFMLGLEYTGEELSANLKTGLPAGLVDLLLNFSPGFLAGLLLGWGPLGALALGGVTYISSSGVIARVLAELKWLDKPETPALLSVLVLEDLAMAVYLPLVSALLIRQGLGPGLVSLLAALITAGVVLLLAVTQGDRLSRLVAHQSDEVILLSTFGLVLVVAGLAQRLHVSASVGAFLVGVAVSGPILKQAQRQVGPLRDLFAALFFLFFGLEIDPATLPPVLVPAAALALLTAGTKVLTGWWTARKAGVDAPGRWRAGVALTARGEFSIVIAGLGVDAGLAPQISSLAAAYVLLLAILGPVAARAVDIIQRRTGTFGA